MYANLSQGIEMLFLFAYAFGRHSAAAVVHFAFLLALPWSMLNYGRRFGFAGAGAAGALLVFLSPVVGRDGTTAYNDVAVAAVIFAVFQLVEIWSENRHPGLLVPIGLAAGFSIGAIVPTDALGNFSLNAGAKSGKACGLTIQLVGWDAAGNCCTSAAIAAP